MADRAAAESRPIESHPSLTLKPSRSSGAPPAPAAFGGGRASRGGASLRSVWLNTAAVNTLPGQTQNVRLAQSLVGVLGGQNVRLAQSKMWQLAFPMECLPNSSPKTNDGRQARQAGPGRQALPPGKQADEHDSKHYICNVWSRVWRLISAETIVFVARDNSQPSWLAKNTILLRSGSSWTLKPFHL